jgi:hypothetical protein
MTHLEFDVRHVLGFQNRGAYTLTRKMHKKASHVILFPETLRITHNIAGGKHEKYICNVTNNCDIILYLSPSNITQSRVKTNFKPYSNRYKRQKFARLVKPHGRPNIK